MNGFGIRLLDQRLNPPSIHSYQMGESKTLPSALRVAKTATCGSSRKPSRSSIRRPVRMFGPYRRQTEVMTELRPAADLEAARWLLRPEIDWWDLVRYGPPGFEAYLRIAFVDDPNALDGEDPALRHALATLAGHTTTPDVAYAAIWEGWGGDPSPEAPRIPIPHREMLLFTGPVQVLRDAPELAWYGSAQGYQEPHLVWPADQAWCLACEVDEEIEFSVGCSRRRPSSDSITPGCCAGGPVRRSGTSLPRLRFIATRPLPLVSSLWSVPG